MQVQSVLPTPRPVRPFSFDDVPVPPTSSAVMETYYPPKNIQGHHGQMSLKNRSIVPDTDALEFLRFMRAQCNYDFSRRYTTEGDIYAFEHFDRPGGCDSVIFTSADEAWVDLGVKIMSPKGVGYEALEVEVVCYIRQYDELPKDAKTYISRIAKVSNRAEGMRLAEQLGGELARFFATGTFPECLRTV